jgi:hypothetical protein
MSKVQEAGNRHQAHAALVAAESLASVGTFIESVVESENTTSYIFEANLKGYVGWRWSVTLAQTSPQDDATVSEIVLLPGTDALVAPDWVPWSERLADYKALQAELERQAAEEAAEAAAEGAEVDGEEDDADEQEDDFEEAEQESEKSEVVEQAGESDELASSADVPESIDAKTESGDAGVRRAGLFGRKRWLKRK